MIDGGREVIEGRSPMLSGRRVGEAQDSFSTDAITIKTRVMVQIPNTTKERRSR
jgi:hypothetical protein